MNKDFLTTLNNRQREAAEKIYGQVLVLAGPGTGKTHLLTSRIANILQKTDVNASNILCLTFTNSATVEMRDRLQKIIGAEAYSLQISTFHGFCEWIMKQFPAKFSSRIQDSEVIDDLQKALIFEEIINSRKWKYFDSVTNNFFWKHDILSAINKLKQENLNPKKFREILPAEREMLENDPQTKYIRKYVNKKTGEIFEEGDFKPNALAEISRKIEKLEELADFWEIYEQKLAQKGFFDFSDQINWVVEALESDENLRLDLQEQFQFILVDEYQDTNNSQNKILWALTDYDDPNIFAVGDDDQSIYRFQGASVANIKEFREKFPNRLEVTLEENYRSTQTILNTAYEVIKNNTERALQNKKLRAVNPRNFPEKKIQKLEIDSQYMELNFLIEKIREKFAEGIKPNEIAILVRKNKEIENLTRYLPKFGIPVAAQIHKNILDNNFVVILSLMLEVFHNPVNNEKLLELLHAPFWEISRDFLAKISVASYEAHQPVLEFLIDFTSSESSAKDKDKLFLKKFLNFFTQARQDYFHCRPRVIAEKLVYESGLMKYLADKKDLESFFAVNKLLDWIGLQKKESLAEILELLKLHKKLNIKISPDPLPADKNAINVMTAHKSKGMEFDIVFVPGLIDKVWGNSKNSAKISLPHLLAPKDFDENEEERRLFFVALTRARREIYLSYAKNDFSGVRKDPAVFWHEVPQNFAENINHKEYENGDILSALVYSGTDLKLTSRDYSLLGERVKNFVWSASALNNYLECPRRFLFQNLYKFPRNPKLSFAYGVAIHEALERFFREKNSTLPELISKFEYALRGQNLPQKDFQKKLEYGKDILEKYFAKKLANGEHLRDNLKLEFDFFQYHPQIEGIRLRGRADKIIFTGDNNRSAKIVDYKSGKPRKIKKGERNWRQLVFYNLLAKNSRGLPWRVEDDCEIEFLTPDSNGEFKTITYKVNDEDRKQVITELREADQKIKNFEFPLVSNPQNDEDIEFWQNFGDFL